MSYTVVKGDKLSTIDYKSLGYASWREMYEANKDVLGSNPDLIKPGQVIQSKDEIAGTSSSSGSGSGSGSSEPQMATGGQTLNNVGGTPEVWKVGDDVYLVYVVPGTEKDPVYMAWKSTNPEEDLEAWFGPDQTPKYNRVITAKQYGNLGVLEFGVTDELTNTSEAPFATWANDMAVLAESQPWILDADYQALVAMAILEGRDITQAEIATTEWYQTHNAAERSWMAMQHGDPATAEQYLEDQRLVIREKLVAAGAGTEVGDDVVEYLVQKYATGTWSELELDNQIRAITDPYAEIEVDKGLAEAVAASEGTVGQTGSLEDEVRALLHTWLGPTWGSWSDEEIARVAGQMRRDPQYRDKFVESLKDQRMAVLPEYGDREISYQAIANTWKQWWVGQWGQAPDESSDLWTTVLKNNDASESAKLLRKEGLAQGIDKVTQTLNQQTVRSTGGGVREAVYV